MESNKELVDHLVSKGFIKSDRVEKAFRKVDRADFVDRNPYSDMPVSIEEDSTISAPHMVAMMLELLEPEGRVLEMGSGSGYVQALLLVLCDEVTGVERIESLVEKSRERVPEANIILGYEAPDEEFDRVLFSFASRNDEVRKVFEKTGAEIVVAPVEEDGIQVLKKFTVDGETVEGDVRFVPQKEGIKNV